MGQSRLRPAVFLDKDGTLIENVPYNVDPEKIRLTAGAGEALTALHGAGFQLVVVSNQSGVARGLFAVEALTAVEARLRRMLADFGVPLAGVYFCPHHPQGVVPRYAMACECRKPAPGMIVRAAEELGLDRARSWMIGDVSEDVAAGRKAGCRTVLIGDSSAGQRPDYRAADLKEAARFILGS